MAEPNTGVLDTSVVLDAALVRRVLIEITETMRRDAQNPSLCWADAATKRPQQRMGVK